MILQADNLRFAYAGRTVLEDVSLQVTAGEIVALVGPNGSGKSTLLRCCTNVLAPAAGSVRLDGRDLRQLPRRELARSIAYIPQQPQIGPATPVFEVIQLGRAPHVGFVLGQRDREVVVEVIETMGLAGFAFRPIGELSGGERQLVLIARALAQEAPIVLLDEPTSALDLRHQLEIAELLRSFQRERRLGFLVAIHDLNLAQRFADRVYVLRAGRLLAAGSWRTTMTEQTIRKAYAVEALIREEQEVAYIVPLRPT